MTSYMTGDYMWQELFGDVFTKIRPYNSFDVKDFNTLDTGAKKDFYKLREEFPWSLLIVHFLGIDHIGHTFDMCHPEMAPKMKEMDEFLTNVRNAMDNDTILILLGDHGMTPEGDHGGSTDYETNTVLLYYTKKGFSKFRYAYPELLEFDGKYIKNINQIHFASTLSFLLGLPIPFSNIGNLITDLYVNNDRIKSNEEFLRQVLADNYINYRQISKYIDTVQKVYNKFNVEDYARILKKRAEIDFDYDEIIKMMEKNDIDSQILIQWESIAKDLVLKMKGFMKEIFNIVKKSMKYDFFLMFIGLLLMLNIALLSHYYFGFAQNMMYLRHIMNNKNFNVSQFRKSRNHRCNRIMHFIPFLLILIVIGMMFFMKMTSFHIISVIISFSVLFLMIFYSIEKDYASQRISKILESKGNNSEEPTNENDDQELQELNLNSAAMSDFIPNLNPKLQVNTQKSLVMNEIIPDNPLYVNIFAVFISVFVNAGHGYILNRVTLFHDEDICLRTFIQIIFFFHFVYIVFVKISWQQKKRCLLNLATCSFIAWGISSINRVDEFPKVNNFINYLMLTTN